MRRINILLLTSALITGCNQQTTVQETIPFQKDSIIQKPAIKDTLKELPELYNIDQAVIFSVKKLYSDENMQNYVDFDLENRTKKSITTVTILLDSKEMKLKMNLKPGQKNSFTHKTKSESELAYYINSIIQKVRFSDGSFLTR